MGGMRIASPLNCCENHGVGVKWRGVPNEGSGQKGRNLGESPNSGATSRLGGLGLERRRRRQQPRERLLELRRRLRL